MTTHTRTAADIRAWLMAYLVDELELAPEEVDPDADFASFGIDSSNAVVLTGDLEDWLGVEVDPTLLVDFTTIAAVSAYLAGDER